MASVKTVERQIGNCEGFDVAICHRDGRDVRSDRTGLPGYTFEKASKGTWTVAQWKESRFYPEYSGWEVDVLDADGETVKGNTLLGNVRETYYE
jgi:hypothetical protein